jgi:hypothetical protein
LFFAVVVVVASLIPRRLMLYGTDCLDEDGLSRPERHLIRGLEFWVTIYSTIESMGILAFTIYFPILPPRHLTPIS